MEGDVAQVVEHLLYPMSSNPSPTKKEKKNTTRASVAHICNLRSEGSQFEANLGK
jgi:hypothetical protein